MDVFPMQSIIFLLIDFNQSVILVQHSGICINFFCHSMYMIDRLIDEKKKNAWETITTTRIDNIMYIQDLYFDYSKPSASK